MFEPVTKDRSLGIFTMLKEIEYSIQTGCEYYYQGYAYEGESFYDYKKRFASTYVFDWNDKWLELSRSDLAPGEARGRSPDVSFQGLKQKPLS